MLTLLITSVTDMTGVTWATAKGHSICVCVCAQCGCVLYVRLDYRVYVRAYPPTKTRDHAPYFLTTQVSMTISGLEFSSQELTDA